MKMLFVLFVYINGFMIPVDHYSTAAACEAVRTMTNVVNPYPFPVPDTFTPRVQTLCKKVLYAAN